MKVNFSIPATLFDYRESDNPLYSYAKLKVFYVGMTGDNRLFTKSFSGKLLKTLPYVPIVGFYDEESEDFKGHHQEIQNIYGIVPEDTEIEFVEEDGREYAVCDVILYTGRRDKTGKIAQKIIGKQHSLELNPETTKYTINRNSEGRVKNIEFTEGSLVGLSVLGDNETPAFSGSGFFSMDTKVMQAFELFSEELKKFAKGQRGEMMGNNIDPTLTNQVDFGTDTIDNTTITTTGTEDITLVDNITATTAGIVDNTFSNEDDNQGQNTESPTNVVEPSRTKEEIFLQDFMRVTESEMAEEFYNSFYERFGNNTYVVQWSSADQEVVFVNFEDGQYHRTNFEKDETGIVGFTQPIKVKLRFLDEEQINTLWPGNDNENFQETVTEVQNDEGQGTTESQETFVDGASGDNNEGNTEHGEEPQNFNQESENQVEEQVESTALNNSERQELEAFRKEKKLGLIGSFSEDLEAEFLLGLEEGVDNYSFEELEIILSKEFTKISRRVKKTKPNTFVYTNSLGRDNRTEEESIQDLINKYKTKN